MVPGYPVSTLGRVPWLPGSWFLITRRTVSVDRLILYPKAEASAVIPRYLNSLPSIGSSAVLGFPGRLSKNRQAAHTKLPISFFLFLPLSLFLSLPPRDPLIGDAWVPSLKSSMIHGIIPCMCMTTLRFDDLTAAITCLIPSSAGFRPFFSALSIYLYFPAPHPSSSKRSAETQSLIINWVYNYVFIIDKEI